VTVLEPPVSALMANSTMVCLNTAQAATSNAILVQAMQTPAHRARLIEQVLRLVLVQLTNMMMVSHSVVRTVRISALAVCLSLSTVWDVVVIESLCLTVYVQMGNMTMDFQQIVLHATSLVLLVPMASAVSDVLLIVICASTRDASALPIHSLVTSLAHRSVRLATSVFLMSSFLMT
jgi:hypothetical protein